MDLIRLNEIMDRFSNLRAAVLGDIFLDRLLYADRHLDELSVETGLTAYQITRRNCLPGAGGVVSSNMMTLGVSKCYVMALMGNDGEAFDLEKGLKKTGCDTSCMIREEGRFTPTYTKVFFLGEQIEETNRIDMKQRNCMSTLSEKKVIRNLMKLEEQVDVIVCLEQIRNSEYGLFTDSVIETLSDISKRGKVRVLVDSRYNLNRFSHVIKKCNDMEIMRLAGFDTGNESCPDTLHDLQVETAVRNLHFGEEMPVYISCGNKGIRVFDGQSSVCVPALHLDGILDICGAGDSALAGIACALCSGATDEEAALVGNLVASVIVQQIGTTGTADRDQVRDAFARYHQQHSQQAYWI